ncbi:MAG: TonB-dependent receptor, partial [Methylococcales bacterium]|nr:TonB-dependent receptor [Methylococcales bacterium]
ETHYRVYAKYFERENNTGLNNEFVNDDWRATRGGFRLDWDVFASDKLTLQGDIYETVSGQSIRSPNLATLSNQLIHTDEETVGGNLLLNWTHKISSDNQTTFKAYYDATYSNIFWIDKGYYSLDIDFQHNVTLFDNHEFIWGVGYRFISDSIKSSYLIAPFKTKEKSHLFSFFLQDEISLVKNELTLILGSKFEHNDFSGFEIQPNARLIWNPTDNQTVWGSISRSVRTSSRSERGIKLNQRFTNEFGLPAPAVISLIGGIGDSSEKVLSYELGYRFIPNNDWSVDLALFYNTYDDLTNFEPESPFFEDDHFVIPASYNTNMTAESYGIEIAATWKVLDNWRINGTYSYLQMQHHTENGANNLSETDEGNSPHHKFSIFSMLNLLPNLEWNLWLKYADNVPTFNIPSYITMDTGISWQVNDIIELSVMGQNLLDSQHPESRNEFILTSPSQVERSVYGKVSLRF